MPRGTFSCSAPQLALLTACAAVKSGTAGAMPALRRLARRLRAISIHSGWDQAAAAAAALEAAVDPVQALALADALQERLNAVAERGRPPATIMMVEDDRATARMQTELLALDGHIINVTDSIPGARALIRELDVDLVLLDLVLPRADGRDLLAELRSEPALHTVPIIVVTGRHDANIQSECLALGADAYLVKPVDPELLRSAVAAALDLAAERRAESRIDRLTGLPNRAAFLDAFSRAMALCQQSGRPLSVALLDLDHFKTVNDTHGHATGDDVLRSCAVTMTGALRVSDLLARWGGEKFCVLLPDTDAAGGASALEKALAAVRDVVNTAADGTKFGVTFSAGVTGVVATDSQAYAIEQADALLYEAKSSGRNRVLTAATAANARRPLVIVADDDEDIRKLVTRIMEQQGFAVVQCADGLQAVEAAKSSNAALAILDVQMPNMNGFETVRTLRALPYAARLPVLMLTGSEDEADLVRAFALGVSDYMTKPMKPGELVARVRRLMNRR